MKTEEMIPAATLGRLPCYHRCLRELIVNDVRRVNSEELARRMGMTASRIRQDFSYFGGFGQQGYGYNVTYVYGRICEMLGVTARLSVAIVGIGNLGRALADDKIFEKHGVELKALFDCDPALIGQEVAGFTVEDAAGLADRLREMDIDIAVLSVPRRAARDTAAAAAAGGVRGIWNFTNEELRPGYGVPPQGVAVQNVHLGDLFLTLCYEVKQIRDKAAEKEAEEKETGERL